MNGFLPDVNLLFAALHPLHADHAKAQTWLARQTEPASIKVCRVAKMGALRLLTSPNVMGADLLAPSEAWDGFERRMQDPRFLFEPEPPNLDEAWRTIVDAKGLVRIDTDTYLAAFALACDHTLATFDKGFARLTNLKTEIL